MWDDKGSATASSNLYVCPSLLPCVGPQGRRGVRAQAAARGDCKVPPGTLSLALNVAHLLVESLGLDRAGCAKWWLQECGILPA